MLFNLKNVYRLAEESQIQRKRIFPKRNPPLLKKKKKEKYMEKKKNIRDERKKALISKWALSR